MSQREILKVLEQARSLIADEACWLQKVYAEDEYGHGVDPTDTAACAWCATGSIIRASRSYEGDSCHRAYLELAAHLPEDREDYPFWRIANFNDSHTHAEVLFLFDRAIARLRQEVQ